MATEFESLTILLLQIIVLICAIQVVLGVVAVYYLTRLQEMARAGVASRQEPARVRPSPAGDPVRTAPPPPPPPAAPQVSPRPAGQPSWALEILEDRRDIQGSIHAICEKYGLSDLVIATQDGLVVVSLRPGAAEEAARISAAYRRGGKAAEKGVTIRPLVHRGDQLLAILRTDRVLDEAAVRSIDKDVAQILNWWL